MAAIVAPSTPQAQIQSDAPQAPTSPAAQSLSQDPLFEALVKHVTSGWDAQPIGATQLNELITNYTQADGGRQYLESIVNPSNLEKMPVVEKWEHQAMANGFISTNFGSMTVWFNARQAYDEFRGTATGIFPPQVLPFDSGDFYWNGAEPPEGDFTFELVYYENLHIITVTFINLIFQRVGVLFVSGVNGRLPPQRVIGNGKFTRYLTTQ